MRWQRLFDDLEAQLAEEDRAGVRSQVADRTRRERASVTFVERLAAQSGPVELLLLGGRRAQGRVEDLGRDFLVLAQEDGRQRLVPIASVVAATGLSRLAAAPSTVTAVRRFGLGYALRALSRDRATVAIDDVLGRTLTGTLDAVGSDWVDVGEHPTDAPRRAENVVATRTVPFAAIIAVVTL